jgi:hypothetical protein
MLENIKLFATDNDRLSYEDSENYLEPYVSYVDGNNSVYYNKPPETRVVIKYNVTSTSEPTEICNSERLSDLSEIEIDGVIQSNIVSSYTFNTLGEHTVKYTFVNPTTISNNMFEMTNLTSIFIPSSVTTIGNSAFYNSINLTSMTIPDNVINIGMSILNQSRNLTNVIIGSGVTNIGASAFSYCFKLTSITVKATTPPTLGNLVF